MPEWASAIIIIVKRSEPSYSGICSFLFWDDVYDSTVTCKLILNILSLVCLSRWLAKIWCQPMRSGISLKWTPGDRLKGLVLFETRHQRADTHEEEQETSPLANPWSYPQSRQPHQTFGETLCHVHSSFRLLLLFHCRYNFNSLRQG